MATRTRKAPATTQAAPVTTEVAVQATEAATVDAVVTKNQPTAQERLVEVLGRINKVTAKDLTGTDLPKWGKAVGLAGGGSVYINRSNADVRSSTKQVAEWVAQGLGTARGPQGQYLRITF